MTVYAIAQSRLTDRAAYNRYQARITDVFCRYHGTLLAADEQPQVVEGNWDWEKAVLMSFPAEAKFRSWPESAEYQEVSKDRKASAHTVVLLVKGLA